MARQLTQKRRKKEYKPYYSLYLSDNEGADDTFIKQFESKEDCELALQILETEFDVFESMGYCLKTNDECCYFMKGDTEKKEQRGDECDILEMIYGEDSDEFDKQVAESLEVSIEEYKERRKKLLEDR